MKKRRKVSAETIAKRNATRARNRAGKLNTEHNLRDARALLAHSERELYARLRNGKLKALDSAHVCALQALRLLEDL